MIAVIDYGGGNIGSVKNALDFLKIQNIVTCDPDKIQSAEKIILPGQGRFGDVMEKLREKKLDILLSEEINKGKPYLGICIGLQILFRESEEDPGIKALGILGGTVRRFSMDKKVPQIGWNSVRMKKRSALFRGIVDNSFFYFVHSFFVQPNEDQDILCTTRYGLDFTSAVQRNNLFAVQFHPEKSGEAGLKLLKNFGELKC